MKRSKWVVGFLSLSLVVLVLDANGAARKAERQKRGTGNGLAQTNSVATNQISAVQARWNKEQAVAEMRAETMRANAARRRHASSQVQGGRKKRFRPDPERVAGVRQKWNEISVDAQRNLPPAARPPTLAAQIVEKGADYEVVEHYHVVATVGNRDEIATNRVMRLASGLNYRQNGEWERSEPAIRPFARGAVADTGQHKVIFARNLRSRGSIDMLTPDNKRLRSNVLGLYYMDTSTGKSVMIAQIQDSIGQIVQPNQIVYHDAFQGVKADVRYTYRRNGIEQDVIILEQPPAPAAFGLHEQTTSLEVMTEFVESPKPNIRDLKIRQHQAQGPPIAEKIDEVLEFGRVRIGPGWAFRTAPNVQGRQEEAKRVRKKWFELNGRKFLLEGVNFDKIQESLQRLPVGGQRGAALEKPLGVVRLARYIPDAPRGLELGKPVKLASLDYKPTGYVLDYVSDFGSQNFVFRGDTTYLVTDAVSLDGETVFEGGAVIKFESGNGPAIWINQSAIFKTGPYSPVVFTAVDDDSVGEEITGISTGTPAGYYGGFFVTQNNDGNPIRHARFKYLDEAIGATDGASIEVQHAQFVNCNSGFDIWSDFGTTIEVMNSLFYNCDTIFRSMGTYYNDVTGYHLTINQCNHVAWYNDAEAFTNYYEDPPGSGVYVETNWFEGEFNLTLANSIVANTPNMVGLGNPEFANLTTTSLDSTTVTNGSGLFETFGNAGHYLPPSSPMRDQSLANIPASLAAELPGLTTTATPSANVFVQVELSGETVLQPSTARDDDGALDQGYHYAPIDYAFARSWVAAGGTVAVKAGTIIATFSDDLQTAYYGLGFPNANWKFEAYGNPIATTKIVTFDTVQEPFANQWFNNLPESLKAWGGDGELFANFVEWCGLAGGPQHLWVQMSSVNGLDIRNSQFHSGSVYLLFASAAFRNCLFDRAPITVTMNPVFSLDHSTLSGEVNAFNNSFGAGNYTFHNNIFLEGSFTCSSVTAANYNGYGDGAVNFTGGANDQVLVAYQDYDPDMDVPFGSGPLGYHYNSGGYAYNFNNAGSDSAANVGLYHFTTATDQTKEGNTMVDLGFHYVAVDGNGNPIDGDGDGLPDYFEDQNGNNVWDGIETDLATAYTFSPDVSDAYVDQDYDGVQGFDEYGEGSDPTEVDSVFFVPMALANWDFDDTVTLNGAQGQEPIRRREVVSVSSWANSAVNLLVSATTDTKLLNVNIVADPNDVKTGHAAYGLTTSDYWNTYLAPGSYSTTVNNMKWSDNEASSISMTITNGPGQWGTSTPNDAMFNSYAYDWNGQGVGINFSGLPAGDYTVYAYGHGAAADQNTDFYPSTSQATYPNKYTAYTANWWDTVSWIEGDLYVKFQNIEVPADGELRFKAFKKNGYYFGVNGMQLLNIESGTKLAYRTTENSGIQNIGLRQGTISMWVRPNWISGSGPGHAGRLIEIGKETVSADHGWWSVHVDSAGSNLVLAGQAEGTTATFASAPVSFADSTKWRFLTVTYSASDAAFYLDGQPIGTVGNGVSVLPPVEVLLSDGFSVGTSTDGLLPFVGAVDHLECFNYAFTAAEVLSRYETILAADFDGDGVPNSLDPFPSDPTRVGITIDAPVDGAVLR